MKRLLHTRMVPLLALFSAFSFVIMMFNLPLPGGTTGHAVGMGIAAIVLGPWASMIAVSIALLIQAIFFGDGGITTFGANSLNMAIIGSFVAYWTYRAVSGRSPICSPRRVIAAGLAGYLAINVAALFAAVEFGLQPMLFHDAGGAPLYAPYPLSIAIPAMALGHLTFAGLAELVITAGLVAYLQRTNPEMLKLSAPGAEGEEAAGKIAATGGWAATRGVLARACRADDLHAARPARGGNRLGRVGRPRISRMPQSESRSRKRRATSRLRSRCPRASSGSRASGRRRSPTTRRASCRARASATSCRRWSEAA